MEKEIIIIIIIIIRTDVKVLRVLIDQLCLNLARLFRVLIVFKKL